MNSRFSVFHFILISVVAQTLLYESFTDNVFTTDQEWKIVNGSGIFSDCGTTRLFGGYRCFGQGTKVMRLFELPPHFKIKITLEFWKIDSWDDEDFYLYVDQIIGFSYHYGPSTASSVQICGNMVHSSYEEYRQQITRIMPHKYPTAFVFMTPELDGGPNDEVKLSLFFNHYTIKHKLIREPTKSQTNSFPFGESDLLIVIESFVLQYKLFFCQIHRNLNFLTDFQNISQQNEQKKLCTLFG